MGTNQAKAQSGQEFKPIQVILRKLKSVKILPLYKTHTQHYHSKRNLK